MYRKKHTSSPFFRLPTPHNPVTGQDAPLTEPHPYMIGQVTSGGITARDELTPGEGSVILHILKTGKEDMTETTKEVDVRSVIGTEIAEDEFVLLLRDEYTRYWAVAGGGGIALTEMCLAEDHPGRDTVFTVYKGVWDGDTTWTYPDVATTYEAIDRRYGIPNPDAGSKGLFIARVSATYGTIYEVVSLDCASPGECDE